MTTFSQILPLYLPERAAAPIENESPHVLEYELVQKAVGGDVDAFEQIYWRHHRRVFGICVRMTKNVTEAEDLTQQVFLQLFRKIGSFRGDAAFTTWLHRMTVNMVLMHFRANRSCKEETTESGELPEGTDYFQKKPKTESVIDNILLSRAIERLPEGYRKIFILHDIQGFDHEEIGGMLGCAAGTSKSQLFKARRKLRLLLTKETDSLLRTA